MAINIRIARELFAALPVDRVLVTAVDELLNSATGHLEEQPILSVEIPSATLAKLNLHSIDPSEAMKNFVHNMDFRRRRGWRRWRESSRMPWHAVGKRGPIRIIPTRGYSAQLALSRRMSRESNAQQLSATRKSFRRAVGMRIKQIRAALAFVATTMLAACMEGGVIEVATIARKGLEPQPGVEEIARVGDVLVTRFNYEATPVAVLQGDVAGNRWRMRTGFQRRDSLASVRSNAAYQPALFCEIPPRGGAVCLGDTDDDGRLDQSYALTVNGVGVELDRIDPVSYEMMEESTVGSGFKYELIYQGMANDVFRLSYREFKDDFARPAFAQDLTYTLDRAALPEVIAFRDLSIEVIEIERSSVTYRVVK